MNYADLDLGFDRVNFYTIDNSTVFVGSENEEYMARLDRYFTNSVKNAHFMPSYKVGTWDGKIRFLSRGKLPRGLLDEAISKLKEWEIPYVLSDDLKSKEVDLSKFEEIIENELVAKQPEDKKLIPWDTQIASAKALLKAKRGISRSATSSGKSYSITMCVKFLLQQYHARKILLVVPRTDLVVQFQRDAIEYGMDEKEIGMYFGKVKDTEQPWIIATWQTLQNVNEREFFEQFDALIIDEVHLSGSGDKSSKSKRKSGGTVMRQICDWCSKAEWRMGFTGTLPEEALEVRTIVSGLGPVKYELGASEMMERGRMTKLKIIVPFISYEKSKVKEKIRQYLHENDIDENMRKEDIPPATKYNAEKFFIESYIPRLKYMSKIVKTRLEQNENVLILANSIKYGKNIKKIIEYLNKDDLNEIYHIHGTMDTDERKRIRQLMEDNQKIVVVATTSLFSTGISVKNLHAVVFANMGKSKITSLQSVGRVLRMHDSKKFARIYDFCDNLTYSTRHVKERLNYYAQEEFDVKIIDLEL